jgi:hypothetical protein
MLRNEIHSYKRIKYASPAEFMAGQRTKACTAAICRWLLQIKLSDQTGDLISPLKLFCYV